MIKRLILFSLSFFLFFLFYEIASSKTSEEMQKMGFIGADTCKACHESHYESYKKSIHSKPSIKGPANEDACESCHGPGAKHVEKGGGRGVDIFYYAIKVRPTSAKDKTDKCMTCHQNSKNIAFWSMSKHNSAGLSCDNCHTSHSRAEKNLKKQQPELCFDCHKDIKMQSKKQSRHPIIEGKISCNDCHEIHGEFGPKMIKADTFNELCYKCHADKRGPFMFEHPPVEENCLNCHTPHGSNHSKLLTKKTTTLCQSCHDWTMHPGTAYTSRFGFQNPDTATFSSRNKLIARSCLNCHTNIHGGNGTARRGPKFTR